MKTRLITLILIVATTFLNAQEFEVGGGVTLNSSWILNQNAYEVLQQVCPEDPLIIGSEPGYALTVGYSLGAKAAYNSDRFWGLAAEVNYTKRGQNYKDNWQGNNCPGGNLLDFKRKFSLHYLEIPLLVQFKSQNRSKVKGYGEVGLQIGLLMSAKEKITFSGLNESDVNFGSANDKVKRFDMGILLGGGAQIELTDQLYVNVGLRTYFGFFDINDGDALVFISNNDNTYQKSRNFSVGVNAGVVYVFDWVGGLYR